MQHASPASPKDLSTVKAPSERKRKRRRMLLWILGIVIAIRIALPYVLLHLINDRLERMPGYTGHVVDIDLALIRGAYRIETFNLDRVDSVAQDTTAFLAAGVIDLSVEWKALFHGSIVGELVIDRPEVYFTKDAVEPADVQEDTVALADLLDDLMPLQINRVEVNEGVLRFIDPGTTPRVDISMTAIELLALNLRNSYDSTEVLPSSVTMSAALYGGTFALNMRLNPLADDPTLDMDAKLNDVQLPQLNDFMQAYANVDVNKGTFGLYSEIATRDRAFTGYVKPIIKDLDVLGKEDKKDPFLRKFWEGLVGTVGDVLTNPREDQVATKVELKGSLDGPRANIFYAVIDLLRNAFIQALQPAIDHEVNIGTVNAADAEKQGFLKRLFNPSDEKKKEKEEKKEDKEKEKKSRK